MLTPAPLGTPCGHAENNALPSAMFTSVMMSFTVTPPPPSQLPTHGPADRLCPGGAPASTRVGRSDAPHAETGLVDLRNRHGHGLLVQMQIGGLGMGGP